MMATMKLPFKSSWALRMKNDVGPASRPADSRDAAFEGGATASLPLSKRAARRLIQRAFVLVGRDRNLRQHLREASVVTLWVLEDWKFAWTVGLDRGKIYFERRPARHPDLTLTWRTAEEFFHQIEAGVSPEDGFELAGNLEFRKFSQAVYQVFSKVLLRVLRYPFDDAGNRLA